MIKLFLIVSCICLFLMSGWFLLPRFLEQPNYKVIKKEGYFEVRSYSKFVISSVLVSGSQYNSLRKGFRPLVKYISGKDLSKLCLENGILCKETHETTIRYAPPLTISKKELDWAIKKIKSVFEEVEKKAA